jgi:hypothetical protein
MLAKVKVRGSPYRAVKPGVIGEVVEVKFRGTRQEHFKVRFKDGSLWSFYFDELEILDASKV